MGGVPSSMPDDASASRYSPSPPSSHKEGSYKGHRPSPIVTLIKKVSAPFSGDAELKRRFSSPSKRSRSPPVDDAGEGSSAGLSPLQGDEASPTLKAYMQQNITGKRVSMKDVIREQVERVAERKAKKRQVDSTKPLTPKEIKAMKNKDKLLEAIRIRAPVIESRTTFSFTIKWDMVYTTGEAKVDLFELQWRLHESENVDFLSGESSLDRTPWDVAKVRCKKEWTIFPRDTIDEGKRMVYIGGLRPCCPVVVFRVRGRNLSGWGSWSRESVPISSLSDVLPAPQIVSIDELTCTLSWKPKKNWEHYGQILYYRVWGNHVADERSAPIPLGFFASQTQVQLFHGRKTEFVVGNPAAGRKCKPLAPRNTYSFSIECRTGLSRADKRYRSIFNSEERIVRMPCTVPQGVNPPCVENAASTVLRLSWTAPICDGGSTIVSYSLMGVKKEHFLASDAEFKEYYRGSNMECAVGDVDSPESERSSIAQLAFEQPLEPATEYGFQLVARNEEGASMASRTLWAKTLSEEEDAEQTRKDAQQGSDAQGLQLTLGIVEDRSAEHTEASLESKSPTYHASPQGMVELPPGWCEYWDPDTGECFYYNDETKENQWERPAADVSAALTESMSPSRLRRRGTSVGSDATDIGFRKRRFRFFHDLGELSATSFGVEDTRPFKLTVRRDHLVTDSFIKLRSATSRQLRRTLRVEYEGEDGIDSGGIGKDWFLKLSREMMGGQYCLFEKESGSKGYYTIDARSGVLGDANAYFRVFGRLLGKALCDQQMLDLPLCHGLYKKLLGRVPTLEDLAQVDPVLAKSLSWMLENDITGVIDDQTFSVIVEEFGSRKEVAIVPRGSRMCVTESNKAKYVEALVSWHFAGKFSSQLKSLLEGFYELVPFSMIESFSSSELELLFNGWPTIDVVALESGHVMYTGGYTAETPTIRIFWSLFRSMDDDARADLLRFTTGSSKMPLDGFPSNVPFTITKSEFGPDGLPTAHTCFNQLVLPPYTDEASMRAKLDVAFENMEGFYLT